LIAYGHGSYQRAGTVQQTAERGIKTGRGGERKSGGIGARVQPSLPRQTVSDYAARKWLLGEAIPSQDKLRILAKCWAWQTIGYALEMVRLPAILWFATNRRAGLRIDARYRHVSEDHQTVVRELVAALRRAEKL